MPHNPPAFVTFTGLDEKTDLARVAELSSQYHVEWGLLFSKSKQGLQNRYPSSHWIQNSVPVLIDDGVRLAAHVCGEYSRQIMEFGEMPPLDFTGFRRIQVNTPRASEVGYDFFSKKLAALHGRISPSVITQTQGPFPEDYRQRLYDPSGGRGERPDSWPLHPGGGRLVGYAGGINPSNVLEVVSQISSVSVVEERYVSGVVNRLRENYWIDMESGVRTDDWLDLDKCEEVLSLVGNRRLP